MSKIVIDHCIYLTEEEVIELAEKHNLNSENLWCDIREIPVKILYDTESESVEVEVEK